MVLILILSKMPDMVASTSSQRFNALVDFQRTVDVACPSHFGHRRGEGLRSMDGMKVPPQPPPARHVSESWQQTLAGFLAPLTSRSSSSRAPTSTSKEVTTYGRLSPRNFIAKSLKRAFWKADSPVTVKRARVNDYCVAEPMQVV